MSLKILVTGGAGYVGAALVEQLGKLPSVAEIKVYDNLFLPTRDFFFNTFLNKEKVKFVEGDILDTRKLSQLVKSADVIIHLASVHSAGHDNATLHLLEQVNHWGTAELGYAAEGSGVKKILFLSTTEVYGRGETLKTEKSETNPASPFAHSKLRGEAHLLRLANDFTINVFRVGTVVGHSHVKSDKGVANAFFYDALIKKKVTIHGDGKQFRPFVSLRFLVSSLVKSVENEVSSGIYNLSQSNLQILDLLEEVKNVLPETEFIFTNHHLHLPSLLVSSDFSDLFPTQKMDMAHEYGEYLKQAKI